MKKHVCLWLMLLPMPAAAGPGFPTGWGGGSQDKQGYEFGTAPTEGADGGQAAYIRARPGAARNAFFTMTQCVDSKPYGGHRMRLSARLKTVKASAGHLWMRVDEGRYAVSFDNMYDQRVTGTTGWQGRDIVLDVPASSTGICYGFMLDGGEGEVWADDLKLEPVGFSVPTTSMIPGRVINPGSGGYNLSHGSMSRFDGR